MSSAASLGKKWRPMLLIASDLKVKALVQGGKVAKTSFFVQLLLGITEVFIGILTFSVALMADGMQSFADAGVSLIVWMGLRVSRRAPDGKFQFGYHRFETLSSIVAALFMAMMGAITLYASTKGFLSAATITNAGVAIFVVSAGTCISTSLLIYKTRAAKKYSSVALKTDATNSIKDVLTSITAFVGITLNAFFGIPQTDAIAGIIISLFVFTMVHSIIKEASLALLDACQCPEIITEIEKIAKHTQRVKRAHNIRMRKVGSYLIGDMQVAVDGNMTVEEACKITSDIEVRTKQVFAEIMEFTVRIEPCEKETGQMTA